MDCDKIHTTELLKDLQEGDQQAFLKLVTHCQGMVVNTARGFVQKQEDAEDIAQEVFLEAYRSIGGFRQEAKLSSWLYRITINKSLNHLRNNKRYRLMQSIEHFFTGQANEELPVANSDYDASDARLINDERSQRLHQAINSLAKNQRIAFVLHKYEDLSYKEVGEVMNISLSAVESLIHRARKNLQKNLMNFYKKD